MLTELLRPFASRNAVHDLLRVHAGSVAHYLARLATTGEHWAEASAWFEQALEQNARMGALPALTRTRHEYARMLARRGQRRDLPRARALLAAVLADAAALGLERLRAEAEALRRELERPADAPPPARPRRPPVRRRRSSRNHQENRRDMSRRRPA